MTQPSGGPRPDALPEIPGYQVLRRLGEGGMARIFLALQLSLQRQVALKVLSFDAGVADDLARRFEREARTIARLDHPHIVAIHEVGRTADGALYYTMPYLPNGDLAHRDYREQPHAVLAVLHAVCEALEYAHAQGVVHRDVKPENILFDKTDRPLLADFGIALTREDNHRVTKRGATLGSSGYMSPEQARGAELDGRTDLYSLGIVAYEMLTGELPFTGGDALAMAVAHAQDPVPRLPPRHRAWQAFIDRALAKSPNDRFQSAAEMRAALDALESRVEAIQREQARGPSRSRGPLLAILGLVAALAIVLALARGVDDEAARPAAAPRPAPRPIATAAVDAAELDRLLTEAGTLAASGDDVRDDGRDAASALIAALSLAPESVEARAALDALLGRLEQRAVQAIGQADGAAAAQAWEQAYAVAERSGIPNYPAFAQFEKAYVDAVLTKLRAGDASVLEPLEPALSWARLNHPEVGAAEKALAAQPRPGDPMKDEGGPELVFVPPGAGVERAYAMMVHEVTRREFDTFARATSRRPARCRDAGGPIALLRSRDRRDPGFAQAADQPVVCVDHADARDYAAWLSARTGARYRLPTAAEWRRAAEGLPSRAASACGVGNLLDATTKGAIDLVDRYDCSDGAPTTTGVGRFRASRFGIHDLVGNVAEWTADCARSDAGGCAERSVVGSSFRDGRNSSLLKRTRRAADLGAPWIGFRLVREVPIP